MLEPPIERQQASARRSVMAGAEGERRLDLDADAVGWNARAVVRPVHQEAPGRDRLEPGEARGHPVARRDRLDDEIPRRRRARNGRHELTQRGRVRRSGKMRLDAPAAVRLLEGRHRRIGADLGQRIRQPAGGLSVTIQARKAGDGWIGRMLHLSLVFHSLMRDARGGAGSRLAIKRVMLQGFSQPPSPNIAVITPGNGG